jgi:cytochrome oxidase Cu insertion factor (SCO1/SenC/PrrC family)
MKQTKLIALALVSALSLGCAAPHSTTQLAQPKKPSQSAAAAPIALDPQAIQGIEREIRAELDQIRNLRIVGMDDGPVPDFELRTADGAGLNSKALVGQEAFVVVFFATWCDSCGQKLTSLQRAVHQLGRMRVIPVSMDGPETWARVPSYLRSFGVREASVRASDHPLFASSYNPFQMVPVLVIVGKNGGLVDYQLGFELEQEQRLVASLRLAETIGPLAPSRSGNGG